jgi:hypothetical protein
MTLFQKKHRHLQNMKTLPTLFLVVSLPAALHGSTVAFDIQTGTNTQTSFTPVTSFPASDGTVSMTVSQNPSGFRDRGVTAPITGNPDAALLRDLAFWSTSNPIVFTFSGLQTSTEYSIRAWVFDSESGNNGKNIDFTTGGGTISITTNNTDASLTSGFAIPNFISDAGGSATITMDHTGGAGGAVSLVNGFELTVIPEPSSALMLGLLAGTGLLRRRR